MKKLFQYFLLMLVSTSLVGMDKQTIPVDSTLVDSTKNYGYFHVTCKTETSFTIGKNELTEPIPLTLGKFIVSKTKDQAEKIFLEKLDAIKSVFEKMKNENIKLDIPLKERINRFKTKLEEKARQKKEKISQLLQDELEKIQNQINTEQNQEKLKKLQEKLTKQTKTNQEIINQLQNELKKELSGRKKYLEEIEKSYNYLQEFLSQATEVKFDYKKDPWRLDCYKPRNLEHHDFIILKYLGTYDNLKIQEFFQFCYYTVQEDLILGAGAISIWNKKNKFFRNYTKDTVESVVGSLEPAAIAQAYNEGRLTR